MKTVAIHSTRTIIGNEIADVTLLIQNGKIYDIVSGKSNDDAIELGNKVLMAGIIDPHVHINEPGRTEWEGFDSATKSAIAGGITCLVDMPLNATPVTTSVKAFEEKLQATTNKLHTNCGFWGGIVPGNEKEIEGLIKNGILGFKTFLTHSGIDDFPNALESDLDKAMPILTKNNLPLLVHCELSDDENHCINNDSRSYANYLSSRPKKWEDDAIAMMIRLCEKHHTRVHIVHLSSADSIPQIIAARQKGLPISVETGQHYLYFNAEDIPDGSTAHKCAPPIRDKENNDQLWEALQKGVIDFVATDHSPATADLKELDSGNFMKAWGGIASIQLALPVLWTAAKKRNCSLTDIAKWLCENPAKLPGLEMTKGIIAKGYDADLIVWDPEKEFTVENENLYHKNKVCPYQGHQLFGVVEQTWLAGEKVFSSNEFLLMNRGKTILS
jgi:allantoinase